MLLLGLLLACHPQAPADTAQPGATLLVSDLHGDDWFLADASSHQVRSRYAYSQAAPEDCEPINQPGVTRYCVGYQARARTAADGVGEVDFTFSKLDLSDGYELGREDLLGEVHGVAMDDGAPRWSLRRLDFSGVDEASRYGSYEACQPDPTDPCEIAPDASDSQAQACRLYQPHDLQIISEDADGVRLWIADTRNARVLRVRVRPDSDCGVVEETLSRQTTPDWDVYLSVNALEVGQGTLGDDWMLLSVKDSYARGGSAEAQQGGDGRGKIVLFERAGEGWRQAWEFPPQREDAASFVNAPHGVAWTVAEDGTPLVLYAHALGTGEDWNEGEGGTVGVLSVQDGAPVYLFDGTVGEGMGYARDVRPTPEGGLLVTDSGCMGGFGCEQATGVWSVHLGDLSPSGLSGAWTPTREEQALRPLEEDGGPWFGEQADIIYSVEWVEAEK